MPKQKTLLPKRLTWFVLILQEYLLAAIYSMYSILLYFLFPTQQSHNNHHAGNVFRILLTHVFVSLNVGDLG